MGWKKTVHGLKAFIVMDEIRWVNPYPTSQSGHEIKYFLLEGCLGMKVHWLSLQAFRHLIIIENFLERTWPVVTSSIARGALGTALRWLMAMNLWRAVASDRDWYLRSQVKCLSSLSVSPWFQASSTGNQGALHFLTDRPIFITQYKTQVQLD